MFTIRAEKQTDYAEINYVITEAFKTAVHSDGNEQDLVKALRKSTSYIPELSLVAVDNDKIVGHILFTKAKVNNHEVLALAPLSVLPQYQRKGIGLSLIQTGHKIAKEFGYDFSVVLGYPEYYSKSGYIPASRYGIKAPFIVDDEYFMALCLTNNPFPLNGVMKYDDAFNTE